MKPQFAAYDIASLKRKLCVLLNYQCNWFIVESKET